MSVSFHAPKLMPGNMAAAAATALLTAKDLMNFLLLIFMCHSFDVI
jgi:hypothetical protein